jgi:hypothetical protein
MKRVSWIILLVAGLSMVLLARNMPGYLYKHSTHRMTETLKMSAEERADIAAKDAELAMLEPDKAGLEKGVYLQVFRENARYGGLGGLNVERALVGYDPLVVYADPKFLAVPSDIKLPEPQFDALDLGEQLGFDPAQTKTDAKHYVIHGAWNQAQSDNATIPITVKIKADQDGYNYAGRCGAGLWRTMRDGTGRIVQAEDWGGDAVWENKKGSVAYRLKLETPELRPGAYSLAVTVFCEVEEEGLDGVGNELESLDISIEPAPLGYIPVAGQQLVDLEQLEAVAEATDLAPAPPAGELGMMELVDIPEPEAAEAAEEATFPGALIVNVTPEDAAQRGKVVVYGGALDRFGNVAKRRYDGGSMTMQPGPATVTVTAPGYLPVQRDVLVKPDSDVVLDVEMQLYTTVMTQGLPPEGVAPDSLVPGWDAQVAHLAPPYPWGKDWTLAQGHAPEHVTINGIQPDLVVREVPGQKGSKLIRHGWQLSGWLKVDEQGPARITTKHTFQTPHGKTDEALDLCFSRIEVDGVELIAREEDYNARAETQDGERVWAADTPPLQPGLHPVTVWTGCSPLNPPSWAKSILTHDIAVQGASVMREGLTLEATQQLLDELVALGLDKALAERRSDVAELLEAVAGYGQELEGVDAFYAALVDAIRERMTARYTELYETDQAQASALLEQAQQALATAKYDPEAKPLLDQLTANTDDNNYSRRARAARGLLEVLYAG